MTAAPPPTWTPPSSPPWSAGCSGWRRRSSHHANRVRPNPSGLKVGGHQASSASMVTIMTALWFRQLRARRTGCRSSRTPRRCCTRSTTCSASCRGVPDHAARVRRPAELSEPRQGPGPGRLLDRLGRHRRDRADLGRAGPPLRRASSGDGRHRPAVLAGRRRRARRGRLLGGRSSTRWSASWARSSGSSTSTGSRWTGSCPTSARPGCRACSPRPGWQVLTVKYGHAAAGAVRPARRRRAARPHRRDVQPRVPAAAALHRRPAAGPAARRRRRHDRRPARARRRPRRRHPARRRSATSAATTSTRCGEAFRAIDDTRPTVIFAYTVKGYGLATEGHPQNHSSLLTAAQFARARRAGSGPTRRPVGSVPGRLGRGRAVRRAPPTGCAATRCRPPRPPPFRPTSAAPRPAPRPPRPRSAARCSTSPGSAPDAAARVVTVAPDVSSSTNLGGWVNKVGVWAARERVDWFADDPETILHWRERPTGQHLELGIAETNLVGLLGELGATWSRWGQPLLPIGVLYDPFVERALEPWSFGIYAGGQSILVGTPSGVTLAPEGGAHQSITTPSIGLEQPGCVTYEPAFAIEVEWTLLASLARLGRPDGTSAYLRLSTRPVDQAPGGGAGRPGRPGAAPAPGRRRGLPAAPSRHRRRGHDRRDGRDGARGAGGRGPARGPRARRRRRLRDQPRPAVRRGAGARRAGPGVTAPESWILDAAFPARRAAPLVTVLDGHPHTLAFLAGDPRGAGGAPGRHAVRPVRRPREGVPPPRPRRRQRRRAALDVV